VLALVPCGLAVAYASAQLLFALALIVLWVILPFALLAMLFQSNATALIGLLRQGAAVCVMSWTFSAGFGLVFSWMLAAAQARTAALLAGLALLGLVVTLWAVAAAGQQVGRSVQAVVGSIALATGVNMAAPFQVAGRAVQTAAGVGLAAATGGASMA